MHHQTLLHAYYRLNIRTDDYLIKRALRDDLSAMEVRILRYLLNERGLHADDPNDVELSQLIRADLPTANARHPVWLAFRERFVRLAVALESFSLASVGVLIVLVYPDALATMARLALISLLGMVYLNETAVNQAFSRNTGATVLRYFVVAAVILPTLFLSVDHGMEWITDTIMGTEFEHFFRGRLAMLLFVPLFGFGLGTGYYFGTKLFLFLYSLIKNGPVRQLRMLAPIWVSRGFGRSVFSALEVVPGYSAKHPAIKNGNVTTAAVVGSSSFFFHLLAFASTLVFKTTLFFLWPMIYLAQTLSVSSDDARAFVSHTYRSRLAATSIAMGLIVLTLAIFRVAAILNIPPDSAFAEFTGFLRTIDLWSVVSVVGAVILMATTKQVDRLFANLHDLDAPIQDHLSSARWAILGVRVRQLLVIYTIVCLFCVAVPAMRNAVLPWVNPTLFVISS